MHLIQRLDFELIDVNNHTLCRQSCEDKKDYHDLCMFAIFDGKDCFHYKMTLYDFFHAQEKALFIPTTMFPNDIRIMFVRHEIAFGGGSRDVLSKVEFQKSQSLINGDSGICSTPGNWTMKQVSLVFQNNLILAYGGDVSCNFESELWFKGHCNWIYSSSTSDFFDWSKHPSMNGK